MIRVVLADDQALIRSGVRALLESAPDLAVVAEAGTGREAVAAAREHRPDVVVMDIRMPDGDGVWATQQLCADPDLADVKVLILTTFELDEYTFAALRAGASGFLGKGGQVEALIDGIRTVHDGGRLLSPAATAHLVGHFLAQPRVGADVGALGELTDREREIVALVGRGLSNDEIAAHLVISPLTAKTHVTRAMVKTGVRDRAQLVVLAYRSGLLRAE